MSKFAIYLPPRLLDPLPLKEHAGRSEPLSFVRLLPPPEDHSVSLSLSQRQADAIRRLLTPAGPLEHSHPPQSGGNGLDTGRKRKRESDRSLSRRALAPSNQDGTRRASVESGVSQESAERRASKRVTRASAGDSLMPTLPPVAASASILSLNTTTSNPSQMVGNDTTLRLPTWHIHLSRLASLSTLQTSSRAAKGRRGWSEGKQIINLIVCVMNVDSPVCRKRAEERAKGLAGTLWIGGWKVTAPPIGGSDPPSAGVKLWDNMAQEWGDDVVRKGDVVLLENVEWKESSAMDPAHISISPSPGSAGARISILYRTLPRYLSNPYGRQSGAGAAAPLLPHDLTLRPDLRLGRSDPGVRKVADVARWFADWVEGVPPDQ